ncbi:hypothetical protein ABTZ93_35905 [Streptomyces sp. NPDC097941]|uniref:terpene synthase family protein n=1 Tax=Streptomyces sp. NPDC097941 TaxID=3155685 RepID=UPI003319246A
MTSAQTRDTSAEVLVVDCPFPDRSSPYGNAAAEYVRQIAAAAGVRGRAGSAVVHGIALGEAAALTYPDADEDRLAVAALWIAFLVLFDDTWSDLLSLDEGWLEPVLEQHAIIHSVLDGHTADDPLARLLGQVLKDIHRIDPLWDDSRLRQEIKRYLAATLWELDLRDRRIVPDVTSYLRMRRVFSTMTVQLELDYFVCRLRLSEQVRSHPCVQLVDMAVADYGCIANDLYSFEEERTHGLSANIVTVLQHEYGWDIPTAEAHARKLCARAVDTYEDISTRPARYGLTEDDDLRRYFAHYEAFMSAAARWPARSDRYRSGAVGFVTP